MLIDKGISQGEVISIKLSNGDELIGRLESESTEEIKVERPLAVTIGPQGLGMMPWVFLGARDVHSIKKIHIYSMMPSKKEAADQYMQGTTGIALR